MLFDNKHERLLTGRNQFLIEGGKRKGRDRQTDRQAGRQSDRWTDGRAGRERQTDRDRVRQTETQRDTDRVFGGNEREGMRDWSISERQADRQTDRVIFILSLASSQPRWSYHFEEIPSTLSRLFFFTEQNRCSDADLVSLRNV